LSNALLIAPERPLLLEVSHWQGQLALTSDQRSTLIHELREALAGHRPLLKRARRRCVFRLTLPGAPGPMVVKAFPLGLGAALRYRKYALSEFNHYAEAAKRATATPKCWGYLELRRAGFVRVVALAVEDLVGWQNLGEHIEGATASAARELVVAALAQMFDAGVNHIDTTPANFMLSPDLQQVKVIDWQYASFPKPRNYAQILLQAGRLLSYANISLGSKAGDLWVSRIHRACALEVSREDFVRQLDAVMHIRQPYRDRLALKVHLGDELPHLRRANQNSIEP
jgi:hypothetical protein